MLVSNCALVLLALQQTSRAPQTDAAPKNLRIVVERIATGGHMTLEGGFLAISEWPWQSRARVFAYTSRHSALELVTTHDGLYSLLRPHVQAGRFLITVAREAYAGDLNGDGDTLDYSSVVYDMQVGVRLPSFAVLPRLEVGHGLAAFNVSELQDARDWTGDGDQSDAVAMAWDLELGTLHHPQVDTLLPWTCSEGLVSTVLEYRVHQDLNGDGDQSDGVYHALDFVTGSTTNTALAAADDLLDEDVERLGDRALAVVVGEHPGHHRLMAYSLETGAVTELAVEPNFDPWSHFPFTYEGVGRWIVFGRSEYPGVDWNADGDVVDFVLFSYDAATDEIRNTQLALGSWIDSAYLEPLGSGALAFHVPEGFQGKDLNGDGDQIDWVLHVLDLESGSKRNTQLAGAIHDGILYVGEQWDGSDRNGDGDALDTIPFVFGGTTGPDESLGVASGDVRLTPGWAAVVVWESQQGADLNGDGDQVDSVLHSYERATGGLVNLRLPVLGGFGLAVSGHTAGVAVSENGTDDWNGDGDRTDHVFHLVDLKRPRSENLGLATSGAKPALLSDALFAFAANEVHQGADLDGNGAIEHVGVAHVVHAPFFRPARQP